MSIVKVFFAALIQSRCVPIAVIYRPPDAPDSSFAGIIKFLDKCIEEVHDDSYQFNLLGDFIFQILIGNPSILSRFAWKLS